MGILYDIVAGKKQNLLEAAKNRLLDISAGVQGKIQDTSQGAYQWLTGASQPATNPTENVKRLGRSFLELLNLPSYALGGALKELRQSPPPPAPSPLFAVPQVVRGAVRGIREKTPLMEEAPSALGLRPESLPGLAVGLAAEIATPGPETLLLSKAKKLERAGEALQAAGKVEKEIPILKRAPKLGERLIADFNLKSEWGQRLAKRFGFQPEVEIVSNPFRVRSGAVLVRAKIGEETATLPISKHLRFFEPQAPTTPLKGLEESQSLKRGLEETPQPKVPPTPKGEAAKAGVLEAPQAKTVATGRTSETIISPPTTRGGITPPKIDFTKWKDRPAFLLSRETLERNIEKIAGEDAEKIKQFLTHPIRDNETRRVEFVNNLRKEAREFVVKKLGIRSGSKEDALIQRFGEGRMTLDELKKETPQWREVVAASDYFRKKYDDLLDLINRTRASFGYDPIPKRKDYFRHFQELGNIISQFGVILKSENLPTEIAGITEFFTPGKPFTTAELARRGGAFTESAIKGMDNYLDSVSRQIFHLDSVQRVRAMEKYIREAGEAGAAKLPNFVANLREYGNLLAGKKAAFDRAFESVFGRPFYGAVNWLRGRTAANMVGGNVSSALTNFIPLTQSLATTSKPSFLRGLFEATASPLKKSFSEIDGVRSSFLVRRFPEKNIDPTKFQKLSQAANWLFESVDRFAAKAIVAGKYYEALSKGLKPKAAMRVADEYAAKVMADRSIGQLPNIMNVKSLAPLTQFQTEVNNMFSFLTHDIPHLNPRNKLKILNALAQFSLYSYLFNNLFEKATGRRPTFDPVHAALTVAGLTEEGEGKPLGKRVGLAAREMRENLPFVGGFTGGRFPIAGGLPSIGGLITGEAKLGKELAKPVSFILPPVGGLQAKKTIEGLSAYQQGRVETPSGKVRAAVEKTPANLVRGALFGQYAFPEVSAHFKRETTPSRKEVVLGLQEAGLPSSAINALTQMDKGTQVFTRTGDELIDRLAAREIGRSWGVVVRLISSEKFQALPQEKKTEELHRALSLLRKGALDLVLRENAQAIAANWRKEMQGMTPEQKKAYLEKKQKKGLLTEEIIDALKTPFNKETLRRALERSVQTRP